MSQEADARKPVEFDYSLDVRFDDLDSYGHVNSTRYLDYVSTARLLYMERAVLT
jgi:acyl-CoA thioesterase FadM